MSDEELDALDAEAEERDSLIDSRNQQERLWPEDGGEWIAA